MKTKFQNEMFSTLKLNKKIGSGKKCLIFSKMRWSELPLIHNKWAKYGTLDVLKHIGKFLGKGGRFITHSARNKTLIPYFSHSFRKKN